MSSQLDATWPVWLRDIDSLLAVHPHFVLAGNTRDWYHLPSNVPPIVDGVGAAIHAAMADTGFDVLLTHDIVDGFAVIAEDEDSGWAAVQTVTDRDLRGVEGRDLGALSEVLRALARGESRRLALVLEHASRLTNRPTDLQPAELELFRVAAKVSQYAARVRPDGHDRSLFNPVFWLVEREHDLPAWLTAGNPGVRSISIPAPDLAGRDALARLLLQHVGDEQARNEVARQLAIGTEGLGATALFDLAALFVDQGIEYTEPDDAIRTYKVGAAESPWRLGHVAARLRGDVDKPNAQDSLSSRVLGQQRAVIKTVDILTRSVMGLSGAQASRSSSRPRGVLFFVGPTGTGKTELAKSITELVFGSSDAYIRFDMSEFAAEHAGDRLIGAPPGYVGFDSGGELTNAVRRRPYSLLLFDEIEKAHPLILDKFLQVLEDGRLTDGRGTTVHFSETLIVFTSNIGTYRISDDGRSRVPNITPADDYEAIEDKVRKAVHEYFSAQLNRPELLNRIGDNVIVFDFIRPEVGCKIVDQQVANVLRRVNESVGVSITITEAAADSLRTFATADLSFGGRGIGNMIESHLVNPLARALFAAGAQPGSEFVLTAITDSGLGPEVHLQ